MYEEVLQKFSKSPKLHGNYAGFLFTCNRKSEALPYLELAEDSCQQLELQTELLFYTMAHILKGYKRSRENLDKLLSKGVFSASWDLSQNIVQAKLDNHPYLAELKNYAKRLTGIDYS